MLLLYIDIVTLIVLLFVFANVIDYMLAIDKMEKYINRYIDDDLATPIIIMTILHVLIQIVAFFITGTMATFVSIIGYSIGGLAVLLFTLFGLATLFDFIVQYVRKRVIQNRKS